MITFNLAVFVTITLLAFLIGEILGILAVFIKLHRRFNFPWSEPIWSRLTLKYKEQHKPYKLIVAGNYGQFRNWVLTHIIHAYANQHLVGRDWDEIEIIKAGDWRASPLVDRLKEYMTKEQWEQFLNDPVY